jgi:hypothetical protein
MSGLTADEAGRGIDWEGLAMDGAMTNAPLGGKKVGKNPTARGQIGTKRSVLSEGGGVPIGLAVEGAKRHDGRMARDTIARLPVERPAPTPEQPQGLGLEQGDADAAVRDWLTEFGFTAHSRARGEEAQAIPQAAGSNAR